MYRSNGAPPRHRVGFGKLRAVRLKRFAGALLVPGLLATAAACAGQGGAQSGHGKAADQSLTMAIQIAAPTSAPVYLADTLGYFKQQGLDVNVKIIANDYLNIAAGQIPFGLVGVSQLIPAAEKGIGLQEVCVTQTDPSYVLAVSQKTLHKDGITPSMSLKETLTRLKGEKVTEVGGPLTPGGFLLGDLLKRNGLPSDWIKVISQTSSASATASFYNGQVGVVFQPQPVPDQLLSKVPGRIIFTTRGSSLFADLSQVAWSGVVGSKSYIAAHPDVTKKLCAAIGKANDYITSNPGQAAEALQPKMSVFAPKFLKLGLTTYRWAKDGAVSAAQFDAGVKTLASYGIVKEPSAQVLRAAYTSAYQS